MFTFMSCCVLGCGIRSCSAPAIAAVTDVIGLSWWIAGAVVLQDWITAANATTDPEMPNDSSRNAVAGLSWALMSLFAVQVMIDLALLGLRRDATLAAKANNRITVEGGYGEPPPQQQFAPLPLNNDIARAS